MRLAISSVFILATAGAVAAEPETTSVELESISSSPCDDAIAQLDPRHETQPAPTCKQFQQLAVAGLGTVALDRIAGAGPTLTGYALVLSIKRPTETVWTALTFAGGGCGAGTCVEYKPQSARLVRLDPKGDPTFGVEIESTVEISHTFKDLGPPVAVTEHYRLACAARARVLDCKEIVLGGRGPDCRVLGWHGTAIRYACTDETQLVPGRSADTEGIPQVDVERVQTLLNHIDRVIADNRDDCAGLVTQIDKLLQRDDESVALARALDTPAGALPHSLARQLHGSVMRLSGSHTCLENVPVQDALDRLFHALGFTADFHLPAKP